MKMAKNKKVALGLVAIVVGGGGLYYWRKKKAAEPAAVNVEKGKAAPTIKPKTSARKKTSAAPKAGTAAPTLPPDWDPSKFAQMTPDNWGVGL